MRKGRSVLLVTGILLSFSVTVILGCASRQELEDTQSELDEAKVALEERNERIEELESKIENLKEERDQKNEELKERIKTLEEEKSALEEEQERAEELKNQNEKLQEKLSEVSDAKTRIERDNLVVTLEAQILFGLGKAELKDESRQTLDQVAEAFAEHEDRPIAVEGHTDTIPIRTDRFPSNWHLSTARAVSVIQYLVDQHEITPERFIATGFGEHHPVASNDSEENRSKNRRVEVVLYPPGITGDYQTSS
jgi:chemotaxis protein MotB